MKSAVLLLIFFCFNCFAQIPKPVINEIDLRVKHELNASIVVGVYENQQAHFYVAGWQNKAENKPATLDSVYEIGSISKTFTGLLLAIMAEKYEFQLDEAIHPHWPKPFQLVDQSQQAITFKHLATHTSGLPRLPANINLFSNDPYANYSRNDLISAVMSIDGLNTGSYAYSNFGAGLLGESMAVLADDSYNNLIQQYILEPLSLSQTYMTIDEVPNNHLAQGYAGDSQTQAWNFQALAGAGSIRSSIKDLLAYGVGLSKARK